MTPSVTGDSPHLCPAGTVSTSETSFSIYQPTDSTIPEDSRLNYINPPLFSYEYFGTTIH